MTKPMVMNVIRSVYEDEMNQRQVLRPALHEVAGKGNDGTFEISLNPGADVHSVDKALKTLLCGKQPVKDML